MTKDQCKSIIFKLATKYGVSPKLIATHLLSEEDKQDMQEGLIPLESLDKHVKVWVEQGCQNMNEAF